MPKYDTKFGISPHYQCVIKNRDLGVEVVAYLPDSFQIDVAADYTTPFTDFLFGSSSLMSTMLFYMRLTGSLPMTREMTMQLWNGSSPAAISLPLILIADTNAEIDVSNKALSMLQLTAARESKNGPTKGFIESPGPSIIMDKTADNVGKALPKDIDGLKEAVSNVTTEDSTTVGTILKNISDAISFRNQTSIIIGGLATFDSVIVRYVSNQYNTLFDKNGNAIKASVDISFETFMTPTFEEYQKIFGKGAKK
jgi:hypothetical protein